ncbi:hypothetical protein D9756_007669 [Leucocoprinus leucothites]|uniref:F-box domain-containing protein n=1 Tax=Leucocoprinus leucothites TaxID=201217 RepID=A0A8H5FWW1_9AGAR|nr:hypothetical protein D9756_007669 [Leucoagaricus leucothites]
MTTSFRQREAIALNGELQGIDDAMADLVRKRADVCFRINGVCATTSVFAPELLATIFQHVCFLPSEPKDHDPHSPIILASVSRCWRQVVRSTPSLWTSLGISFWDSEYISADAVKLLRTYFEKSASLPVSLRLNLPRATREGRDVPEPPSGPRQSPPSDGRRMPPPGPRRRPGLHDVGIKDVFEFIAIQNPAKLRALFIDELPLPWLIVYIWGSPYDGLNNFTLPSLERLHVIMPDIRPVNWPSSRTIPSSTIPRLTHLVLEQKLPLGLEFPYHQLTTLELDEVPINDCFRVIRSCTNVVNCYCRRPRHPPDNSPGPLTAPIRLSHVKTFAWTFGFQRWDEMLLQCISLPALEVFICEDQRPDSIVGLENKQYNELSWRNLQSMFLHQSPNLRVFKSLAIDPLHWDTRSLASDLPQTIQELHLRYVNANVANSFMSALTPKPGSSDSPVPFPHLKYLNIEIENIYWIKELVLDFVRARRSQDLQALDLQARLERLDLRRGRMGRTGGQMDIAKNLVTQFQEFVDDGLFLVTAIRSGGHMKWSRTRKDVIV